jgi:hypothetical protein
MLTCRVDRKGGTKDEKNVSAEKASAQKRAWFPQEDENKERA